MALEIFRLIGSVFVDTEAADKSLQKTDKNAGNLGQTLSNGIQSVGKFAAGIGAAVGAASAGMVAITESTRDYRTEQGKLQAAFETSGFTAEAATNTYKALNGVLGDSGQAVEAANHLAKLADNEEDLSKWTNIATGIFATFGDSLPIEGLTEAANESAKVGEVTGSLADALNWAGVSEEAFNKKLAACTSEQQRQKLIADTLNGVYSDAADRYREVNGEVIAANEAQDNLNATMAGIGETLEPIITQGKELLAEILERLAPILTDVAEVAIPLLTSAFETLVGWVETVIQWFSDAYTWIKENETAVTLIAIAIGTLTAAIIAWNIAQNAATIATTVATAATTAFGSVMAFVTSPITLVVAAIGALIAIVVLLVKNWDDVKAAALAAWEFIKDAWNSAANWFNDTVIQPIVDFFSGLGTTIKGIFSDAWAGVKSAWSGTYTFFSGIWKGIKNAFSSVTTWFKDVFSKAWKAVKDVFSTGGKIFSGIVDGITDVFKTVVNAIIRGINKVIAIPFNAINDILNTLRKVDILGLRPFSWINTFNVPQIPELEQGGVLERGQVGLLEGNGAEAVVPLHQNKAWVSAVAEDMDNAIGGASGSQVVVLLTDILETLAELAEAGLYLDGDTLVGGIAKRMDTKLGQLQAKKARA